METPDTHPSLDIKGAQAIVTLRRPASANSL